MSYLLVMDALKPPRLELRQLYIWPCSVQQNCLVVIAAGPDFAGLAACSTLRQCETSLLEIQFCTVKRCLTSKLQSPAGATCHASSSNFCPATLVCGIHCSYRPKRRGFDCA